MSLIVENSAKAIIVRDGRILLIKNRDVAGLGTWYSLPGGRQSPEECLHDALVREVHEEVRLRVEVGRLLFVREYIHVNHELSEYGEPTHKVEFMFDCSVIGRSGENDGQGVYDEEQEGWVWMEVDDLPNCNIIPRKLRNLAEMLKNRNDPYWGDVLFDE